MVNHNVVQLRAVVSNQTPEPDPPEDADRDVDAAPDVAPVEPEVTPDAPMTLIEAVEKGDYRQILLAQQREIARDVGTEKGPAKAALHRQLALISKEIESLNAAEGEEGGGGDGGPAPDEEFDPETL